MKRNQILLFGRSTLNSGFNLLQNIHFANSLYSSNNFTDMKKWFDYLDCSESLARQINNNMTIDKFLKNMDENSNVYLKVGSPDEFFIRYCAVNEVIPNSSQFFWAEFSYSVHNYDVLSKLFYNSFGKSLDSFEVPNSLKIYHKRSGF